MEKRDYIRTVRFTPYLPGKGPRFVLRMWDTNRTGFAGKYILGYQLVMRDPYNSIGGRIFKHWRYKTTVLFEAEDYGCSPMHAIDSDVAVKSLMAFLTLRPGDTDSEYFANYTPEQLAYCEQHAEALSACVSDRFGD